MLSRTLIQQPLQATRTLLHLLRLLVFLLEIFKLFLDHMVHAVEHRLLEHVQHLLV